MRFLALLPLLLAAPFAAAQSTATYRVLFESTWSAATHPDGFPANPHFSGLVGATHDATASLWAPGALASVGIESMAETGSKTLLLAEVDGLIGSGQAEFALSGPGMAISPGEVSYEFSISTRHPRVSLVTMLAPSPDWFVGVAGYDLYDTGQWPPLRIVPLYVYDAGTDSGTTYTAPDQDTQPREPIAQITGPPFESGGGVAPIGTFSFQLLTTTETEARPSPTRLSMDAPFPNPASGTVGVVVRTGRAQRATVEVLDPLGRRVAVLHEGALSPGVHRFTLDTGPLANGLYGLRARTDAEAVTRRVAVRH